MNLRVTASLFQETAVRKDSDLKRTKNRFQIFLNIKMSVYSDITNHLKRLMPLEELSESHAY